MIIRKLLRNRGLGVNLIAGFCFIFLAVYAWGLSWKEVGGYFLVILVFLVGLIALAALCGWVLRKLMAKTDWNSIGSDHKYQGDKTSEPAANEKAGVKPDAK
ncbi:MAG TPA: hypothetical protein VF433_04455 [Cellvibrio sp.]|jgi:hypothetical protein